MTHDEAREAMTKLVADCEAQFYDDFPGGSDLMRVSWLASHLLLEGLGCIAGEKDIVKIDSIEDAQKFASELLDHFWREAAKCEGDADSMARIETVMTSLADPCSNGALGMVVPAEPEK